MSIFSRTLPKGQAFLLSPVGGDLLVFLAGALCKQAFHALAQYLYFSKENVIEEKIMVLVGV